MQALVPARLQRDHFSEGIFNQSLADAVKAAVAVSRRWTSQECNIEVSIS